MAPACSRSRTASCYAFNVADGSTAWHTPIVTDSPGGCSSVFSPNGSPIVVDGLVYAVTPFGRMVANAVTGAPVLRFASYNYQQGQGVVAGGLWIFDNDDSTVAVDTSVRRDRLERPGQRRQHPLQRRGRPRPGAGPVLHGRSLPARRRGGLGRRRSRWSRGPADTDRRPGQDLRALRPGSAGLRSLAGLRAMARQHVGWTAQSPATSNSAWRGATEASGRPQRARRRVWVPGRSLGGTKTKPQVAGRRHSATRPPVEYELDHDDNRHLGGLTQPVTHSCSRPIEHARAPPCAQLGLRRGSQVRQPVGALPCDGLAPAVAARAVGWTTRPTTGAPTAWWSRSPGRRTIRCPDRRGRQLAAVEGVCRVQVSVVEGEDVVLDGEGAAPGVLARGGRSADPDPELEDALVQAQLVDGPRTLAFRAADAARVGSLGLRPGDGHPVVAVERGAAGHRGARGRSRVRGAVGEGDAGQACRRRTSSGRLRPRRRTCPSAARPAAWCRARR